MQSSTTLLWCLLGFGTRILDAVIIQPGISIRLRDFSLESLADCGNNRWFFVMLHTCSCLNKGAQGSLEFYRQ